MKRRIAECVGCGNEREIYALKRCGYCYQSHKRKEYLSKDRPKPKKKPSIVSKGWSIKAKKQIMADNAFYDLIWFKRVHVCAECGCSLGLEWSRFHFSHILSKGAYPQLRHVEENIDLLCLKHHTQWDHGDKKSMGVWKKNEALIMKLKVMVNTTR